MQLRWLPKKRPLSVLDIGCGLCTEAEELVQSGIELTGIDQDGETIEKNRQRMPNVNWIVGDAAHWHTDQVYDAVLIRRPDILMRPQSWQAVFRRLPEWTQGPVIVTTFGKSEAKTAEQALNKIAGKVTCRQTNDPEDSYVIQAEDIQKPQKTNDLVQSLSWDDQPGMVCDVRTGKCTPLK